MSINHEFTNPLDGYGLRVPLLVISPYSKENYVSDTVLNHMSIIRFIEYNWHLQPLNEGVAKSGTPLDFFDFEQPARPPITLSKTGQYPVGNYPIQIQIPLDHLSYSRKGTWNETTSSSPFFLQNDYSVAGTVAALVVLITLVAWHRGRKHQNETDRRYL